MHKKEILEELVKCSQILYKEGDMVNFKKLVITAQEVAEEMPDLNQEIRPAVQTSENIVSDGDLNSIFNDVSNSEDLSKLTPQIQELKDREMADEVPATISVTYSNVEVGNLAKAKVAFTKLRDYLRENLNSSNIAVEFPNIKKDKPQL
jgi:hypothetical protein